MSTQFYVSSDLASLLKDFLIQQEIEYPDLRKLLDKHSPSDRMTYFEWWHYLALLREHTGTPHIGLEVGQSVKPEHLGLIGYLAMTSHSLLDSLKRFKRFESLLYEGTNLTIETISNNAVRITWPSIYAHSPRESNEIFLTGFLKFARQFSGSPEIYPARIGFTHTNPESLEPYKSVFHCEVLFGQSHLFVEVDRSLLDLPINSADETLCSLLEQQAKTKIDSMPVMGDFEKQLVLVLNRSIQDGCATLETVAERMSMTQRTFQRRLSERNLRFNDLLQSAKTKMANYYLQHSHLSLTEIALLLGYSEHSAFTRAYKLWTGITPLKYQKSYLSKQNTNIKKT